MKRIADILAQKKPTISFEFFSPKTEAGHARLSRTIEGIQNALKPDFLSVTYGAGGSTRTGTTELVVRLQEDCGVPVNHHLTCIGNSREELRTLLDDLDSRDIHNILALRGDPPQGDTKWVPHPQGFHYASELVALVRESFGDRFAVGVAGFPETHPESRSWEDEMLYLRKKIDAGSDYIITQFFFDNAEYARYVGQVREAGIAVPVLPGILPVTDYEGLVRFAANCGASIPEQIHTAFRAHAGDPEKTFALGIEYAVGQCNELLAMGAPGIHFYTANRHESVVEIVPGLHY